MVPPGITDTGGPSWGIVFMLLTVVFNIIMGLLQYSVGALVRDMKNKINNLDEKTTRIDNTYVSRDELDKHTARLEAQSLRMHIDNKDTMLRIEAKVEHGGHTRHEIRDGTNAVKMMLESFLAKLDNPSKHNKD